MLPIIDAQLCNERSHRLVITVNSQPLKIGIDAGIVIELRRWSAGAWEMRSPSYPVAETVVDIQINALATRRLGFSPHKPPGEAPFWLDSR